MNIFKTLLTAFSAYCWLARASVIHLNLNDNSDVTVDIDTEIKHQQNENHRHGGAENPAKQAGPQHIVNGPYDVTLPYEVHRGSLSSDSNFVKFSNIPYAIPPLGPYRFKSPAPIDFEGNELNEGEYGPVCPQWQVGWVPQAFEFLTCYAGALTGNCSLKDNWTDPSIPMDIHHSKIIQLSPYMLMKTACSLTYLSQEVPVLVWIYGGGYVYGWKDQAGSPAPLLQAAKDQNKDIIYVAMNYRLGAFGWLNGPDFIKEGGTPNAGLQDQRLALSWIQDYIGLFGGDKDKVTVMGQSAGASSILHHLVAGGGAEEFKPNFSQAILQSPAFFPEGDSDPTIEIYGRFKRSLSALNLQALQRRSPDDVQNANAAMTYYSDYGLFNFGPKVDHGYVPGLPGPLLSENKYHKGIRMIIGHTALDGLLFTPPWLRDDDGLREYMTDLYQYTPDSVLDTMKEDKYYGIPHDENTPEISKINAVSDLLDDIAVSCNNHYLTKAVLKNDPSTKIWRYLFSAKPAIHGSDVQFTYYPIKEDPAFVVPAMAKFMQKKYVNFVLEGNSNHDESLEWPNYEEKLSNYRKVMKFGDLVTLPNKSLVITNSMNHNRCNL